MAWHGLVLVEAELASEQLHAEQRKDDDEEKQQQQQAGDGAHAVDERRHQIPQRRPISTGCEKKKITNHSRRRLLYQCLNNGCGGIILTKI